MRKQQQHDIATFILEKSNNEYWVTIHELPGCYSSGKTIEEAISNSKIAIKEFISDTPEDFEVPEMFFNQNLEFKIKYDLVSLFEKFNILNKTAIAQKAGINPSLLRQYSKGLAFASEKQKTKVESTIHEIASDLLQASL